MPRRTPRFANLNRLLKATNGTATSGPVFEYQKFLQGINDIDVQRRPDGKFLAILGVGVIPFGNYGNTGTTKPVKVGMTAQADAIRSLFGTDLADADLGIERTAANIENNTGSFYPALIKIAIAPAAQVPDSKVSGVTKQTYKRMKSRSGSIPFGRTITQTTDAKTGTAITELANVDEQDVKLSLIDKIKGKIDINTKVITGNTAYKLVSYSFDSEVWRANRSDYYKDGNSSNVGIPAID